ncbi:MAG: S41 family peptidase [Bacteroidales bacterium]|nr:S41 family peptidase [Bacteroidales bacterium]
MKRYFSLIAVAAISIASLSAASSHKKEVARNLDIFTSIYKTINTMYVDSIDASKSITTAINAMLNEIDPYTEYIPEEMQEDFKTISTGEFGGIGAYISQNKAKETYVSEPQEGTPSDKAGLKAGDVFLLIDGDSVRTIGSDKVRNKLRGQAGTHLTVTIRRPLIDRDTILNIDITRAKVDVATMPFYGVVRDTVGYIALNTFNEKSYPEVKKAVTELLADKRVKGIAIDLRGNTGGLLESAVNIVSLFVPKGTEVLRTRGRDITNERTYRTTYSPVALDIPLAIFIDDGSASSSEILAGALQDLDRAVIIGERSFGKGLVQSTFPIPYNGLVKVTTQRYYIPSGRLIQAIDYSHRNPDGTVARTPDSLTNVFYTRAHRPVRDGGGITPDIKIEYPDISPLTYNVVNDNYHFDFATKYAAAHASIPAPEEFELTDEIYEEFKKSIDPASIKYDKVCDTILDQLEIAAKREGYLDDNIQQKIADLRNSFQHDLEKDLDNNRHQITKYLAAEIIRRYYYNRGAIAYDVRFDENVARAAQLFGNQDEYRSILSSAEGATTEKDK